MRLPSKVLVSKNILKGRGKISRLTGLGSSTNDPMFPAWDTEDLMLMSLLWSSMQPEVSKSYMFSPMDKDIRDTIKRTYSKVQDASNYF